MGFIEKIAKRHQLPYIKIKRIYIGDNWNTYLESDGSGKWKLVSPNSVLKVNDDGGLYISGNVLIDSPIRISGSMSTNSTISCKKMVTSSFEQRESI